MKKKPAPKKKSQARKAARKPAKAKAAARKPAPARKPAASAPAKKTAVPPKTPAPKVAKASAKPAPALPTVKAAAPAPDAKPAKPASPKPPKKGGRKSSLSQRRGPNGEPFVPGDLLLPTGPQGFDEVQYLLRGTVAAERADLQAGVNEIVVKQNLPDSERAEMMRFAEGMSERFGGGAIEPFLPNRPPSRRTFQGVVERAKHRRREIGAFLRGLDLGHTESSHMDSHGEASLQSLMEWAARLEILAEADEPDKADYGQFHRVLDQLDNTTEALIVDVELTLRRLRDRVRA
ncbi:MAG TPA: hypothetical protein VFQ51_16145 [Vicinamibacteria bacterium]|nr:hypothetical protein [Vicinamibacteria bacterium]